MFGAVKLNSIAGPDKYGYSGNGIGFDARAQFSWAEGSWGKIVVSFGADDSFYVHVDNKWKDILVLSEGPTQGLDDTMKYYAKYPINFTRTGNRFVLGLHNNGSNTFLFVNAVKVYQFKAKDSEKKHIHCV